MSSACLSSSLVPRPRRVTPRDSTRLRRPPTATALTRLNAATERPTIPTPADYPHSRRLSPLPCTKARPCSAAFGRARLAPRPRVVPERDDTISLHSVHLAHSRLPLPCFSTLSTPPSAGNSAPRACVLRNCY